MGYGGTKTEMQRLVKDAAKLDKSIDANSLSYGNIVKAIHAIQVQTGIYGTTQKEAEHTITGSLYMVKSAWGNLMPALIQGGDTFDQCLENLIYSVDIFSDNVMPAIEKALGGVGTLIEKLAPKFAEKFPELAEKLLPPLIKAAVELTKGLIKALPSIIKTVATTIVDISKDQFPIIGQIFEFFKDNAAKVANAIKKIIPVVIGLAAAFKMFKGVQAISSLFGGLGKGGGTKGGIFSIFESLAKTKTSTVLKGMANLAIILGGFTALAAAFMYVAPYMAKLTDLKSLLKVILVVGALGVLATGLAKLAEIVGKIPVKTVALGLANMAIMIVGMTALTAAFMFVVPYISELAKCGAIFKVMGIMLALGALGTVLSIFAGIAGVIPILMVLKGLANMAIMLVGMTALTAAFMYVAPKIAELSNCGAIFKVMGIMLVLGALGTILTIFAGICGAVPIPVVLTGLANMGLVIGGIAALATAFGALTQIQGFTDFVEKGGVVLAKICNIIGDMAGSLIGGLGEGLTRSLPAIGESIAAFANSLKPLFPLLDGNYLESIGIFFESIGGFMLKMAGNDIASIFTGGTDLGQLGTDLSTFATNAKPFFTTVSELPENGFTNGKLLFDTLAGLKSLPKDGGVVGWFTGGIDFEKISSGLGQLASINTVNFFKTVSTISEQGFNNAKLLFDTLAGLKSIPKEGGVKGWFTGEINYTNLSNGLGQLAGENVANFFSFVSTLDEQAFSNTKLLFNTLAGLKKLPKDGGVVGWFMGDINYENIANGLGQLSSKGVKSFFAMTSSLNEKAFTNTKLLFDSLASIKELPKEGGFWQNLGDNITGKETKSKLATIGEELSNFHEKTSDFFSQVNKLNLTKLNGLWESLKKPKEITSDLSTVVGNSINDVVNKVSDLPNKMGAAIRRSGGSLTAALVSIWQNAVRATAKPMNKLIEGANYVLKQFGSEKQIVEWTPYARGTKGHSGGNALVNDGRGAELVQMPNGKAFIPQGRNVFIPNAPNGMKVLTAEQTARLMGKRSPTFNYADGTGDLDVFSYIDNAAGLVSQIEKNNVSYEGMKGAVLDISKAMVATVTKQMTKWADKVIEETGGMSLANYNASKGVEQWRSTVIRALQMEGQYTAANVTRTLYQMQTESGGNPRAINLWDSNAKKGTPSKGLMQCIDPTFKAYARAGFDKNIYDPLSNILASIRYAVSRYGSLANAYQGHGYANGGIITKPHFGLIGEAGNEAIIPLSASKRKQGLSLWSKTGEMLGITSRSPDSGAARTQTTNIENNEYAPVFNLTINGDSDRSMERKVRQWIKESMNDVFDSVSRRNPRVREV